MASQQQQQQQQNPKTIPLKILVDKQNSKVVAVEATKDFVDTLFSFLSLPLGTIIRLLNNGNNDQEDSELEPLLGCITNLYRSVETLTPNDVWSSVCKNMLLCPRNPCESLCLKLFLNIDDTEPTPKVLVCDSCNKFTTFRNLDCACGKPINRMPHNLDLAGEGTNNNRSNVNAKSGAFVKENGLFLAFDDLTVMPSSLVTSMQMLLKLGYPDLSQLEELTRNVGKQEILNLLKYTITSHEPLTNMILASNSKKKDSPLNKFASAIKVRPATSDSKMDVNIVQSKSQNKIIFAEAKEDFVDFMFSLLAVPLGSIVKLLDGNSLVGCVDNLYKRVETLDSSWCTDSRSVLINPGVATQFGCPNQPLNIPDVEPPNYYYGTGTTIKMRDHFFGPHPKTVVSRDDGFISKSNVNGLIANARCLTALDPRSPNRLKAGVVGFVKRPALFVVGDDLRVRPLSAIYCLSYLKELGLPLHDLEMKVISISQAEALSLLAASLTSKFTLNSGLEDFLDVPKQESNTNSS